VSTRTGQTEIARRGAAAVRPPLHTRSAAVQRKVRAAALYSAAVSADGDTALSACFGWRILRATAFFAGAFLAATRLPAVAAAGARFAGAAFLVPRAAGAFALAGAFLFAGAFAFAFAAAAASLIFTRRPFSSSRMVASAAAPTTACWPSAISSSAAKKACATFFAPRGARFWTSFLMAMVVWVLSDRGESNLAKPGHGVR